MTHIALLHPVDGKYTGKLFKQNNDGASASSPYQSGAYFNLELLDVDGIVSLAEFLGNKEKTRSTLIVRGLPHRDADFSRPVRRRLFKLYESQSDINEHPFHDEPQPWLMIDVDKYPLPEGVNLNDATQEAVEFVVNQLPEEFHEVSYCWQLSGSAGVFDSTKISVHLWFWLTEAITTYDLKQWSKAVNVVSGEKLIDPTLYNPVQPHYVTNPLFVQPLTDPMPLRFGYVEKENETVVLQTDIDLSMADISTGSGAIEPDAIHLDTHGYENILTELGDHPGGDGFYHPLLRATASLVREKGSDWIHANLDSVIADLQLRVDEADKYETPSRYGDIQRYRSRQYLTDLLEGAIDQGYGDHVGAVPPQFPLSPYNLHEAGIKILREAIRAFEKVREGSEGGYTAVMRAAAGSGKTTLISRILATSGDALAGQFIEYYVPNHALSEQVAADIEEIFESLELRPRLGDHPDPVQVNIIRSYTYRDEAGNDYCLKSNEASRLSDAGLSIAYYLCGDADSHCAYYHDCLYRKQFTNNQQLQAGMNFQLPIINVLAHNHLFLGKRRDLPNPALVIVDESFYQAGIEEYRINPAELRQKKTRITRLIYDALVDQEPLLKALREERVSPLDLYGEAFQFSEQGPDISPTTEYVVQTRNISSLPRPSHIDKLLTMLAEEMLFTDRDQSYAVEYHYNETTKEESIRLHTRKELTIPEDVPLLIIDADANRKIVEIFRPVDGFVNVQVERFAEVHQFNRTFSLNAIQNTHPNLQGEIKEFVDLVCSTGQTLVVAPKNIRCLLTGEAENDLKQIGLLGEASIIHFQKLRGLNDFKDYDNVVVIGREQPPPAAMESLAKALWWDKDEPLNLITDPKNSSYITERRGYRMRNGSPESVETQVHPDRRVQDLLEQIRECEITQAVDRLRLVREKVVETDEGRVAVTRRVFLLTSIPVDITVDHLWNWDHLQEFLGLWEKTDGVLPLGARELLPILSGVDSIPGGKKVAARVIGIRSLIRILISEKVPFATFSYKLDPSAPGKAPNAIIANSHSDPKRALEDLLGQPVGHFEESEL